MEEVLDAQRGGLLPDASRARFLRHRAICSAAGSTPLNDPLNHDTVGCVVLDADGHVAAGVSSGGISLKYSGRVGEAAMYAAGVWTQQSSSDSVRVAVSCSGTGEQIMHQLLAKTVADALALGGEDDSVERVKGVLHRAAESTAGFGESAVGFVAIEAGEDGAVHLGHTTPSLAAAIWTARRPRSTRFILSRKREGAPIAHQTHYFPTT
ncbi:hypothetical protein H9P43_006019 [Blastocladiella emersonii ATCC 22665]|nr:hypothetical protein H9P43_006019 [Blastocladiella emersonii ATCC 22665]